MNYIFSGLPIPFFKVALVTTDNISEAALTVIGRRACEWAADKPVPWMLVVTHEALAPGVAAELQLDVPADDTLYARMGYDTIATHTTFIEKTVP